MSKNILFCAASAMMCLFLFSSEASAEKITKQLELTVTTSDTTESGWDELYYTLVSLVSGEKLRSPATGTQPMKSSKNGAFKWVSTSQITYESTLAEPHQLLVMEEDESSADDEILRVVIFPEKNGTYSQSGLDGYFISWKVTDLIDQGKSKTVDMGTGQRPPVARAAVNKDANVGRLIFPPSLEGVELPALDSQEPHATLNVLPTIGTYADQKYLMMSLKGTRVTADQSGELAYNESDMRGWYLEYVQVTLDCKTPGFILSSNGPKNSSGTGSVTSSSGVNLSTGAELGSSGAGASASTGVDFSTSYSEDLVDYSVLDTSTATALRTKYYMSSSNSVETWSNPKGGDAPYSVWTDLIRKDAAGQFGGLPFNYLPELSYTNFPILSMGTWRAPDGFAGEAEFELTIKLHLVKVRKTNIGTLIAPETADRTISRTYKVNMADPVAKITPAEYIGRYRLQSKENPSQYLNIEQGPVAAGEIAPGWHSAQWELSEQAVDGHQVMVLRNRWKATYLSVKDGKVVAGPATQEKGKWQHHWEEDGEYLKHVASGKYLVVKPDGRIRLETRPTSLWTLEQVK